MNAYGPTAFWREDCGLGLSYVTAQVTKLFALECRLTLLARNQKLTSSLHSKSFTKRSYKCMAQFLKSILAGYSYAVAERSQLSVPARSLTNGS